MPLSMPSVHSDRHEWPCRGVSMASGLGGESTSGDEKKANGKMVLWSIKADHVALLTAQYLFSLDSQLVSAAT